MIKFTYKIINKSYNIFNLFIKSKQILAKILPVPFKEFKHFDTYKKHNKKISNLNP